MERILEVENLKTTFNLRKSKVHAVNGTTFHLDKGEMLGVVGESGCGKSVSMLSIINLLPPAARIESGTIKFDGRDLRKISAKEMRKVRGDRIGMIFQDPMTSLNPVVKIGVQMTEALIHHQGMAKKEAYDKCADLLDLVGISNSRERLNEFPHQLSGGMRQRVMIAMALACDPEILIADEPTTALDVTIQAQIVEVIREIRDRLNTAIILITHDLGLIAGMVDRIVVMYSGFIVEEALVDELYENPRHPYTRGLLSSIPKLRGEETRRLHSIDGAPPDLTVAPTSCPFAPRCGFAIERCREENPMLRDILDGPMDAVHRIACWVDLEKGSAK
ncbi:MAG: ABC transporter ATP-binding protein [Spirochaetales bacterium]|nr:ABC transporter ATP-binding protein [Spirochaetales bacterium]